MKTNIVHYWIGLIFLVILNCVIAIAQNNPNLIETICNDKLLPADYVVVAETSNSVCANGKSFIIAKKIKASPTFTNREELSNSPLSHSSQINNSQESQQQLKIQDDADLKPLEVCEGTEIKTEYMIVEQVARENCPTKKATLYITKEQFREGINKYKEAVEKQLSRPQIIYYSPALNALGKNIAYVKRTLDYKATHVGVMPFLDSTTVEANSDKIELCKMNIQSGTEIIVKSWTLPVRKNSTIGNFTVGISWRDDNLLYKIILDESSYGQIEGTSYRMDSQLHVGGFAFSNIKDGENITYGPTQIGSLTVQLDRDMSRMMFPISNQIFLNQKQITPP